MISLEQQNNGITIKTEKNDNIQENRIRKKLQIYSILLTILFPVLFCVLVASCSQDPYSTYIILGFIVLISSISSICIINGNIADRVYSQMPSSLNIVIFVLSLVYIVVNEITSSIEDLFVNGFVYLIISMFVYGINYLFIQLLSVTVFKKYSLRLRKKTDKISNPQKAVKFKFIFYTWGIIMCFSLCLFDNSKLYHFMSTDSSVFYYLLVISLLILFTVCYFEYKNITKLETIDLNIWKDLSLPRCLMYFMVIFLQIGLFLFVVKYLLQ